MTAITKFYRRGVTKVYLLPAVADVNAGPTTAEVAAGDDITPGMQGLGGFSARKVKIDTPDADSDFVDNIPGEQRPEDSSITYYEDKLASDIRTTLAEDTAAFIAIFPKGKVAGRRAETWPVRLGEFNTLYNMTDSVPALEVLDVFITGKPGKDGVVPAP